MESSGYGSAHLPSPALVVFSQAAGGLGEALRIQRPFHSQLQDAKDFHHLSLVNGYSAHFLNGFPHHFLHPAVTSSNTVGSPFNGLVTGNASGNGPMGSGSVNVGGNIGNGAFVKPFASNLPLPSAFAPPKCIGLGTEQNVLFSGNESFRTDSSSPACTSLSPPVKEESLEGHTSEEGDRDRICSPERSPETPGFRPPKSSNGAEPLNLRMETGQSLYRFPFYNSFKNFHQHQTGVGLKKSSGNTSPANGCPVCGVQLSSNELETHFLAELDRLYKLSSGIERQRIRASLNLNIGLHQNNGIMQGTDSRWETFQRIRTNRQSRLRAKTRKRKGDSEMDFAEHLRNSCPVCHCRLQRTHEEIAQHVEECIRKSGQQSLNSRTEDEDETVDVESYGDETSNSSAINLAPQINTNNNNNINNTNSNNNNNNTNNNNNNNANSNNNSGNNVIINKMDTLEPSAHPQNHHHNNQLHHFHQHHHNHQPHLQHQHPAQIQHHQQQHQQQIIHHHQQHQQQHSNNEEHVLTTVGSTNNNNNNNNNNMCWERNKHRLNIQPMNCTTAALSNAVNANNNIGNHTNTNNNNHNNTVNNNNIPINNNNNITNNNNNISCATSTSSDQLTEYDTDRERSRSCDNDNVDDEEVIVDATDEDDCNKIKRTIIDKRNLDDKINTAEEATSSMEIDSATDSGNHKPIPTPDSYVSTSVESAEPTSRAQVLEELRARIRELEGSPFKVRNTNQDEEHYKCFICKEAYRAPVISTICWHLHCDDCWITLSDTKKTCPQCKIITPINELRKIPV